MSTYREVDVCTLCKVRAVVALTAKQLFEQPDDTTHVCHPSLGGCNHGFTAARAVDGWRRRLGADTAHFFDPKASSSLCRRVARTDHRSEASSAPRCKLCLRP